MPVGLVLDWARTAREGPFSFGIDGSDSGRILFLTSAVMLP